MPLLQYRCEKCGKEFEEIVKSCEADAYCPECGAKAKRCWSGKVFSATGKQSKKCSGNCKTCGGCG